VLAAFVERFGPPDVLTVGQLPAPSVGLDSVLVRVHATSVNPVDCYLRGGRLRRFGGLPFPIVPGVDISGVVETCGSRVEDLKPGDEVFGFLQEGYGAYAEFVLCRPSWLARKPAGLTHVEAAALPCVALTALQGLRDKARLKPGQRVLIVGASGSVGLMAVQIGRAMNVRVAAICRPANADLVRALGASCVRSQGTAEVHGRDEQFDAVFDCVGRDTFWRLRHSLRRGGIHVGISCSRPSVMASALSRVTPGRTSYQFHVQARTRDLECIAQLVGEGRLRPIISDVLPLSKIVQAHHLSESRRAAGKISLEIGNADGPGR